MSEGHLHGPIGNDDDEPPCVELRGCSWVLAVSAVVVSAGVVIAALGWLIVEAAVAVLRLAGVPL